MHHFKVFLYLCGALQRQRLLLPPLGALSHPWQPAVPRELRRGPAGRTLRQVPGRGGADLMGVGPLANPGHAGRGAGPEAAAVERKNRRGKRARRQKKEIWVTYKLYMKWLNRKRSRGEKTEGKKGNWELRCAREDKCRGQGSGS